MTAAELRSFTRKELASMARGHDISGWHGMKKEELVKALCRKLRSQRLASPRATDRRPSDQPGGSPAAAPARNGRLAASEKTKRRRYLSTEDSADDTSAARDSFVAEPLDAHWIRAAWTLTTRQIDRARAALGADWHQAVPVIRVLDLSSSDSVSAASSAAGEHEVKTASQTIYVPVEHSGRSYVLQLACRSESGKLFVLARSNPVKVPLETEAAPPVGVSINTTGRFRLPAPGRGITAASQSADGKTFQVEASLVVRGSTPPGSEVTFFGDPVRINDDGTFTVRLSLDEGRQVIPAVMTTADRRERRTIVLAIERNTRELEPQPLDETGA